MIESMNELAVKWIVYIAIFLFLLWAWKTKD